MDIFVKRGQQRERNSKRAVGEGERERERFWLHRNTVRRELLWLAGFPLCILWEILSIFIGTSLTSKKTTDPSSSFSAGKTAADVLGTVKCVFLARIS